MDGNSSGNCKCGSRYAGNGRSSKFMDSASLGNLVICGDKKFCEEHVYTNCDLDYVKRGRNLYESYHVFVSSGLT